MCEKQYNEPEILSRSAISPIEDLMCEHGILHRVLLIYAEIVKRLRNGSCCNYALLYKSVLQTAEITKDFIENYHQTLENDYIFPLFSESDETERFQTAIHTLLIQHQTALEITDEILRILERGVPNHAARSRLACLMTGYIRMYRPHAAREDTYIFPEVRRLVSADRWNELGEIFEDIEEERFGKNGFEAMVERVSGIEKALGIYELDKFTSKCGL